MLYGAKKIQEKNLRRLLIMKLAMLLQASICKRGSDMSLSFQAMAMLVPFIVIHLNLLNILKAGVLNDKEILRKFRLLYHSGAPSPKENSSLRALEDIKRSLMKKTRACLSHL